MATIALLMQLFSSAGVVREDMTAQFIADASKVMTDLGIDDADVRSATLSELQTLSNTVLQDTYREMANAAAEETGPDGYVYLGAVIDKTRPFCLELVDTWLTREEIDQLDNGMTDDVFATCGGWNCEHGWYPLYGDQVAEYEQGDVEAANAAAEA